jgi:carotenoid cleavage dioxygenase-like enzyme
VKQNLFFLFVMAEFGLLSFATQEDLSIPGFERVLERGAIASIDEPHFVSAEEAEISDDAWVMGVVIDGQARAYSLNLLNSHEVVNDVIADQPIAAVW